MNAKYSWALLFVIAGLLVALPAFAADMGHSSAAHMGSYSKDASSMSGKFQAFHAKDLLGKNVENRQGEDLGKVEDIVFGKDGSAEFVVISHGGTLGAGAKYYPIPFNTFMSSATNMARLHTDDKIIASLEKNKLESAPSFSDKKWDVSSMESHDRICAYYGAGACDRTM
ncbi:MAG: PRC-barrel domain-containing protein [Desulfobacteraceae bacterium]|nr:PRC-barrel domain-containing protein [Desulfobacteraceae bacterium]